MAIMAVTRSLRKHIAGQCFAPVSGPPRSPLNFTKKRPEHLSHRPPISPNPANPVPIELRQEIRIAECGMGRNNVENVYVVHGLGTL